MTRTTARLTRVSMLGVAVIVVASAVAVSESTGVAASPTTVSVSSVTMAEGDSGGTRTAKLLVSLSDKATATMSVTATLAGGNATSGTASPADFKPWSAAKTLTFTSGQKTKTVSVSILADTTDEGNETATVTLTNATGGLSIATGTGTITIADDDPGSGTGVSVGSATVAEGDTGGTRSITLPVTLNTSATSTLSVVATLANGTATGGSASPADDKSWSASKTLTFTSGQRAKTVTISLFPDTTAEADETAFVTLTNASTGLSIRTGTGALTILNDDGTPTTSTCPTANFPDLSGASGAGTGYTKPSVSVSCSAAELKVTSNGMPSYTFTPITPNPLLTQSYNWHVPLSPAVASSSTSVSNWFGTVGFTVTGLPIYAAMEGAQPVQEQYGDPIYNGIVDTCDGHTGPAGEYHLHAMNTASSCGFTADPIVGYALDGFPIYGSNGCLDIDCTQVVTFRSGWVRTGNPTTNAWSAYTYTASSDVTVLDQCNGRIGPDGTYRYYATSGFPYTFGCYKGTPTTQSGGAGAAMPAMG